MRVLSFSPSPEIELQLVRPIVVKKTIQPANRRLQGIIGAHWTETWIFLDIESRFFFCSKNILTFILLEGRPVIGDGNFRPFKFNFKNSSDFFRLILLSTSSGGL